ncbi:TonB-dependent receptor [Zhongshania sp.]|uniref:TonB-dependent receptor n=1 Tax=Zhongshania sp. TaxID=1971902 RepID=UPI001B54BC8F|nr:TonB-dependent receptor [Zhongshania sp.]MBQ0794516.1 TonB-dependent receptor [Zhongshania sp.]
MKNNISLKPIYAAISLSILSGLASSHVYAQQDNTRKISAAIEEVMVTARRRSENMQEIPVSVTAFTSSDIAEIGISDISHISELTPNLVILPNSGGNDGALICMRGLCRTDFTITEDPMVGVYVDGIYVGKSIGSLFDVAELDRVEVLRGPQGTLYGKNTLGGAVILHTRKPSGELGGKATVTAGNYNRIDTKSYIEFPVTDQLAANVSALTKNRDPFVKNNLGDDRWDEDNQALHGALQWTPLDRMTLNYAYDWQKKREQPMASQMTSATGWLAAMYGQDVRPNRESNVTTFGASHSNIDLNAHGLTIEYELDSIGTFEDLALKSISGYRKVENDLLNNATGASSPFIYNRDIFDYDALTQEVQLTGTAFNGFFDFVVGVFYFNEQGDYSNEQEIDAFASHVVLNTEIDNTSKALFTEVTSHLTDKLDFSLGIRYTEEDREQHHTLIDVSSGFVVMDTYNQTYLGAPEQIPTTITESNVSPRVSINYQWNDSLMTFATYARGFKSGGFNARANTPLQWGPYDDMQVDSYELGMKSNWLENRVQFNMTAFHQNLSDMQAQVNAVDPGNTQGGFSIVIQNAAEATIAGAEAELILRVIDGLDISAGYGYIDAQYDEFNSFDINTGAVSDIADDRAFEFSPKNSYNLSLNYTVPSFTSLGTLRARLDWSGTSKIYVTPKISGNDDINQDSYDLLNTRITFDEIALGDGVLAVSIWGKNITDEEYKIGGFEVDAGGGARVGTNQWGEPRTFGIDVSYRFGSLL